MAAPGEGHCWDGGTAWGWGWPWGALCVPGELQPRDIHSCAHRHARVHPLLNRQVSSPAQTAHTPTWVHTHTHTHIPPQCPSVPHSPSLLCKPTLTPNPLEPSTAHPHVPNPPQGCRVALSRAVGSPPVEAVWFGGSPQPRSPPSSLLSSLCRSTCCPGAVQPLAPVSFPLSSYA